MKTAIDLDFITRILKTTFFLTILVALFAASYYNIQFAEGLVAGSFWNLINFWLIQKLIIGLLSNKPRETGKLVGLVLIKFPLLYGVGLWILLTGKFTAGSLLCGFSLLFVVLILKTLGILILSKNSKTSNSPENK